ncbi:MAG: hypothetical protein M0Q14_04970 [Tissierellaceae bacterium]|nr:hypothetical protein [Tissierellaceae bacterium]
MAFFTDKLIIAQLNQGSIKLFRKTKQKIMVEEIKDSVKHPKRKIIKEDILGEYDAAIKDKSTIFLIYQNNKGHLFLITLDDEIREETQLTEKPISEIFNLNIGVVEEGLHIVYNIRAIDDPGKYTINHHYNYKGKWYDYIISEINEELINNMKFLAHGGKINIIYYRNKREIVNREFYLDTLQWSKENVLVSGGNDKLFLDAIVIEGDIHMTYCEYIDERLVVKYNDKTVSRKGSPSHPTILYYKGKLWVSWVELDKITSTYSSDTGENWAGLFLWNKTKTMDFVRYKYLNSETKEDIVLDNSFGGIYPEIQFLGFGSTNAATEVPIEPEI